MERNVFKLNEVVQSTVQRGTLMKGDYIRICHLRGLITGNKASASCHYDVCKLNDDGKSYGGMIRIYHREMKKAKITGEFKRIILENKLKSLKNEKKLIKDELNILKKYKDREDYIKKNIDVILKSNGDENIIKNVITRFHIDINYL